MLMPVHRRGAGQRRHDDRRHRLHLLGLHRLPVGARLQLRDDPRRCRAVAADPGEPRRDGRRLGALRGVGEDPARRDRHRARLLLLRSRRPATCPMVLTRQLDPYTVAPLWPDSVSLAALQARALLDAGKVTESADGRGGRPQPQVGARQPVRPAGVGPAGRRAADRRLPRSPRCASTTARRSPTAWPPWCSPPTTSPADRCERPAWIRGIDHRIEPMALGLRDLTDSPSTRSAGREGRRGRRPGRRGRAARAVHPPGADPARRRIGLGDGVDVNPSGGALAANPMHDRRPHPHR